MSLGMILLIVLILLLVGAFPRWGYSRGWGYGPSGGLGLVLVIVLILVLLGASERSWIRSGRGGRTHPDPAVRTDRASNGSMIRFVGSVGTSLGVRSTGPRE